MIRKNLTTILLVFILLVGVGIMLYPTISDYWNSMHQSQAIASYRQLVEQMDDAAYEEALRLAREYNERLAARGSTFMIDDVQRKEYNSLLNIGGNGVMGYVEIPKISCVLPVYHGTEESVLQIAIGHLEWSSLPVGGKGTHAVVSGHRGLPSAKLFTRLDEVHEGDIFTLQVLDETLTYEVDQINIVLPEEMSALALNRGEDYCSLVTCTPYGINSHRMLIRGHRIANIEEAVLGRVSADAVQYNTLLVALVVGGAMVAFLLMLMLVRGSRLFR